MAARTASHIINNLTVFTRISTAALIKFFAPQMRRLLEGGAYLKIQQNYVLQEFWIENLIGKRWVAARFKLYGIPRISAASGPRCLLTFFVPNAGLIQGRRLFE